MFSGLNRALLVINIMEIVMVVNPVSYSADDAAAAHPTVE